MYREYARGDSATWSTGVRSAERFIAGPLLGHVTTWPRHGRLGVPAGLDGRALCATLSRWLGDLGAFGLLYAGPNPRLLVIPITTSRPRVTLCYGQWPGIETWEHEIEGCLPDGMTLLHTRWNEMPMSPASARADGVQARSIARSR
jgi:hypothetical protein